MQSTGGEVIEARRVGGDWSQTPKTGALIDSLCPYEETPATKALEALCLQLEREAREARLDLLAGFPIVSCTPADADLRAVARAAVEYDTSLRARFERHMRNCPATCNPQEAKP